MLISPRTEEVLHKLDSKSYKAYLVGGAVRNCIMGIEPDDIDITTDATPDEIKEVFKAYKVIETGIQHGTVTVLINNCSFEITTFRTEDGYTDGRHPDKVVFSKEITEDLRRRDFTMNSIAYNSSEGFIDPFRGKDDISNRIIRCVGNPAERFTEDALRILRAIRFASVTGFEIEKETRNAMFSCKHLIKNISAERIYSETVKMLCGKNIKDVLLSYLDIISEYIPEINGFKNFNQHNFHHKYDLLNHTVSVLENIEPIPHLRLAALLHDVAKPACRSFDSDGVGHYYKHASKGSHIAEEILTRLHCDRCTTEKVEKLIKWHDTPIEESEKTVKKKLRIMGEDMLRDLIKLQKADTLGLADEFHSRLGHFDALEEIIDKVLSDGQCFSLKDLEINGYDMMKLGFCGEKIGKALDFALEAVIDGSSENHKEKLIKLIEENADSL